MTKEQGLPPALEETIRRIRPLDQRTLEAARERQRGFVKPIGSLGALEELAVQIAGITGKAVNRTERKVHFLFAADNGVYEEGVSGTPQYFTGALLELYAGGRGCTIDTLCRKTGVELRLFDLGVKGLGPRPGIDSSHKLMPQGTKNLVRERAMPPEIAKAAVELGITLAKEAAAAGYGIIGTGEVGMGNTTTATACIMACLGSGDDSLVGRGGGLTDAAFERKKAVIARALALHGLNRRAGDALEILSCVGGLDIAAMTGIFLGAAAYRVPVVVDGVISIAAALLAHRLAPDAKAYMIASHCSAEPAYTAAAAALELTPLLNLGMRLGEGAGCPLAMELVDNALYLMEHMASFEMIRLESGYRESLKA